jgi:acyl-CoA thioesterase FadM
MTGSPAPGSDSHGAFVMPLTAPASAQGGDAHLSAPEITELFFRGWMHYLGEETGLGAGAVFGGPVVPTTRELTVGLLREIHAGDELRLGVRTVSRRRRSFTLELTLERADDGAVAATCRTVQVCVGVAGAAEVPSELWAALERLEGRAIPVDPAS